MRKTEELFIKTNPDYFDLSISDRSVSGVGSQLNDGTRNIRENLYSFLKRYNISSMFDLPCGDFYWMRTIDLKDISYIGGDIIKERMKKLSLDFPEKKFIYFNIIDDTNLPKVDLLFCRDLLFHLSNEHKRVALQNFVNSGIEYILMSNHPLSSHNMDTVTGGFAHINWQLPPWNFSKPIDILYDSNHGIDTKELQLYTRKQIMESLYL